MDFELTHEQRMLQDAAASFAKKSSPVERFRKLRSTSERDAVDGGWEKKVWREMAELGWLGLFFPESVGGLGLSFFDASLVIEKLGATLVPEPFIASVVLAGGAVLHAASPAQQKQLLEPMIEGKTSLALAYQERASRYDVSAIATTAKKVASGWSLSGEKVFVENGHAADTLIVSARIAGSGADAGLALFAVDPKAKGVTVQTIKTMDGRAAAMIRFENVEVASDRLLGEPGEKTVRALEAAVDMAAAAAVAEGLGIASTVLDMTNAYLKVRKQFGVPIGTFQVLQHKAVDMFVEVELLRSVAILAGVKADDSDRGERERAISIAKAQLAVGGKLVVAHAVQLHGGIGITDEHDVGLYFKRMTTLAQLYGDEEHHLARYAARPAFGV